MGGTAVAVSADNRVFLVLRCIFSSLATTANLCVSVSVFSGMCADSISAVMIHQFL